MQVLLIIFALCVLGTNAIPKPVIKQEPKRDRVSGGVVAANAPHACMVLVHRESLVGTNTAALGGGSIISTRHVVTAAHLVQGANINYQIGFIAGTARRLFNSTFRVIHENYDNTNFDSDIAILFLQGTNQFPQPNVIVIATDEAVPAPSDVALLAGFGFTTPTSTGPSSEPFETTQTISLDSACTFDNFEKAPTHYCALDGADAVVCPGDNGAGLFMAIAEVNTLVGIASRIFAGCEAPQQTAYTRVAVFADWISNIAGLTIAELNTRYNKTL